MSLTGNKDADLYVLLNIEDHTQFLNVCRLNKYTADLCRKDSLFHNRMIKYFPLILDKKPIAYSWKEYYLKTVYYLGIIQKEFPDFTYGKEARGISIDYLYLLRETHLRQHISQMIENNYVDLLEYAISKRSNFKNYHFTDIFEYVDTKFIEKYFYILFPEENLEDKEEFFTYAARGGKSGNYFFAAKLFPETLRKHVNSLLFFAGEGGNQLIIDDMLKYTDGSKLDLLKIMLGAYYGKHKQIGDKYYNKINNMDKLGLEEVLEEQQFFLSALINSDNMELIKKAIKEINNIPNLDYEMIFMEPFSDHSDDVNFIKAVFSLGLNIDKNRLKALVLKAIENKWLTYNDKYHIFHYLNTTF